MTRRDDGLFQKSKYGGEGRLSSAYRRKKRALFVNRFVWAVIFLGVLTGAWFTGERILYLTAAVLFALPIFSYVITSGLLRGLRVKRKQPDAIVKNSTGVLTVAIQNNTFLPLGSVDVVVRANEYAIEVLENQTVPINPFGRRRLEIPFEIKYRGHYNFGLAAIQVADMTGLFRLTRVFDATKMITSLPLVADISNFPLAMNMMTQASSRHDIRDEDYSTISDIRQYLPTDSIKRVHWKLTAKRNEWLVKTFQSNALSLVSIILDISRTNPDPSQTLAIEDAMVENALGLAKFCLSRAMPVDFITTDGQKINARKPEDFTIVYEQASGLHFLSDATPNCHGALSQLLIEASGYVNAVILTPQLNAALYEKVRQAANNGHYIAVIYFAAQGEICDVSEEIYNLLCEGGTPCYLMECLC